MSALAPDLVNPVPVEEVGPWTRAMATTFLDDPRDPSIQVGVDRLSRRWDPQRAWGFRDRGRWVATLRTEPRRLSVPGRPGSMAELAVDALTNVTVAATHRRRGLMSRMLEDSLRSARERGDALSVLIAAEWPIYGRFGYAPATLTADYKLCRGRPGAHCPGRLESLRQIELPELAEVAPPLFELVRRRWAGQINRDADWWQRALGLDGMAPQTPVAPNWLVHESDAGIDGLVGWSASGSPSLVAPTHQVDVQSLVTTSPEAYRDLWAYLTGIDGVDELRLALRPVEEPVRWLLENPRTLVETKRVDFLWLRILDVCAALSGRRYPVSGELVLEISDSGTHGFAAGRYRLVSEPEGAVCEPTDADPDVRLEQRALASAYLGGFRLAELHEVGMVRELRPGGLARADVMLSWSVVPWNATWF